MTMELDARQLKEINQTGDTLPDGILRQAIFKVASGLEFHNVSDNIMLPNDPDADYSAILGPKEALVMLAQQQVGSAELAIDEAKRSYFEQQKLINDAEPATNLLVKMGHKVLEWWHSEPTRSAYDARIRKREDK